MNAICLQIVYKNLDPCLHNVYKEVYKKNLNVNGIKTVDLFNLRKSNYHNGVIGYNRAKTRHRRADEAYMEMRVEPFLRPVFEKYLAPEDDDFLFNFHVRYCDSDSFNTPKTKTPDMNAGSGSKKMERHQSLTLDVQIIYQTPSTIAGSMFNSFEMRLPTCIVGSLFPDRKSQMRDGLTPIFLARAA